MPTIIKRTAGNAAEKTSRIPPGGPATDPELATALKVLEPVIEIRPTADLKVNPRNARRHDEKQRRQLAASIREFGFLGAVIVDEDDIILAGHLRVQAAELVGLRVVPTIRVTHLTLERKRAFMLADNRLAELADWDEEILKIELGELASLELDFEFEVTGFDTLDLDLIEGKTEKETDRELLPQVIVSNRPSARKATGK